MVSYLPFSLSKLLDGQTQSILLTNYYLRSALDFFEFLLLMRNHEQSRYAAKFCSVRQSALSQGPAEGCCHKIEFLSQQAS